MKELQLPSREEQAVAMENYKPLAAILEQLQSAAPEIEIEETGQVIQVPLKALKLLGQILKATSEGKPVQIMPVATEMTTQAAADLLGCSRPHITKLLDSGEIPFEKVGRHRRVRFEDIMQFKEKMKMNRKKLLAQMIADDEKAGLYDT